MLTDGDWHWTDGMMRSACGCVQEWLRAVHARISRGFTASALSEEEERVLRFAQALLEGGGAFSSRAAPPAASRRRTPSSARSRCSCPRCATRSARPASLRRPR